VPILRQFRDCIHTQHHYIVYCTALHCSVLYYGSLNLSGLKCSAVAAATKHPNGPISDPTSLMAQLQRWEVTHALTYSSRACVTFQICSSAMSEVGSEEGSVLWLVGSSTEFKEWGLDQGHGRTVEMRELTCRAALCDSVLFCPLLRCPVMSTYAHLSYLPSYQLSLSLSLSASWFHRSGRRRSSADTRISCQILRSLHRRCAV
jgi:hypothetical protein